MLCTGGLERHAVTLDEIRKIEPSLTGNYYGGFYCPGDATGDIHKFTTGLANVTQKNGVNYLFGMEVVDVEHTQNKVLIKYHQSTENMLQNSAVVEHLEADAVLVCGGVGSYQLANQLGDRVNVYPVKGYSITVQLDDQHSIENAPGVACLMKVQKS